MLYDTQNLLAAYAIGMEEAKTQRDDLINHAIDTCGFLKNESSSDLHNRIEGLIAILEVLKRENEE